MQKTSSLPDKPFTQHFVIWVYKPKVMPKTETEVVYLLSELCRRLNLTLISTVVNYGCGNTFPVPLGNSYLAGAGIPASGSGNMRESGTRHSRTRTEYNI